MRPPFAEANGWTGLMRLHHAGNDRETKPNRAAFERIFDRSIFPAAFTENFPRQVYLPSR